MPEILHCSMPWSPSECSASPQHWQLRSAHPTSSTSHRCGAWLPPVKFIGSQLLVWRKPQKMVLPFPWQKPQKKQKSGNISAVFKSLYHWASTSRAFQHRPWAMAAAPADGLGTSPPQSLAAPRCRRGRPHRHTSPGRCSRGAMGFPRIPRRDQMTTQHHSWGSWDMLAINVSNFPYGLETKSLRTWN